MSDRSSRPATRAGPVRLVLVCWLVTFFDGFDTNAIAFAAPYLAKAYSFDKAQLAGCLPRVVSARCSVALCSAPWAIISAGAARSLPRSLHSVS